MYVAFLFGAKLTVLGATNGVARVKIYAEVFFCSVGGQTSPLIPPPSPRLVKILTGEFINESRNI